MTKEEKIKESYKEHWDKLSTSLKEKVLSNNGWLDYKDGCDNNISFHCIEMEANHGKYRPASLRGIENNNGWFMIESENDLPSNDNVYYWYKREGYKKLAKPCSLKTLIQTFNFVNKHPEYSSKITHYKPIEEVKHPIH